MENKVYKVLSEWKLDNSKEKFKGEENYRLYNVGCTTGPTFFRLW